MMPETNRYLKETADCILCPRQCHRNRLNGETGYCGQTAEIKVARAALHMWEEPCISGESGSGAVFFSGCQVRCVFCQNKKIAVGETGKVISSERLSEIFLELQDKGACNINLVTPTHFVPQIVEALIRAKDQGMRLPVVYNTSSYEMVDTLRQLEGLVDIFLPDLKYVDKNVSFRYSAAPDYFEYAKKAIQEMVLQAGKPVFDKPDGLMKRGVIVRHLVLPGFISDSKKCIKYLYETYGNDIYISIMNQYTPMKGLEKYPELNRKLRRSEYNEVVDFAINLGVENGFIQEGETAKESFIPEFDMEGVEKDE